MTKAFSLLELLVVTAILGLLAAILFPVFASAKREAKRTACVSNLHQLGVAAGLYQAEANDLLPVGTIHRWRNVGPGGVLFPEDGTRDVLEPLQRLAGGSEALNCPINDSRFVPRWVVNVKDGGGDRLMLPDASNILADCMHHLQRGWRGGKGWETINSVEGREGNHLVLRGDLSGGTADAKSIRASVMERVGGEETWRAAVKGDDTCAVWHFATEKWPPQWLTLPEAETLNWGRIY